MLGQGARRDWRFVHAAEASQKATEILEQLTRSDLNNATLQEYLGEAYGVMAAIFLRRGNVDQSLDYFTKAREVFARLSRTDPTNSLARDNAALMEIRVGYALLLKGRMDQATPQIRDAIHVLESLQRKNRFESAGLASAYAALGRAFFGLAGQGSPRNKTRLLRASQSWFEKSLRTFPQGTDQGLIDPLGNDVNKQSVREAEQVSAIPHHAGFALKLVVIRWAWAASC